MTLIIGTPLGVWGDRKITSNSGEVCDPLKKVVANDVLVAGFAGDFFVILKAIQEVESGTEDPKLLAKVADTSGKEPIYIEGIVVKQGRIYILDSGKSWVRPKGTAYYGMGTGGTTAMAFLSGIAKVRRKVTDDDISAAFHYVSKCRDDCSSTHDYLEAP